ncbi:hypothetical protein [Actinokineospora guangxiensis]
MALGPWLARDYPLTRHTTDEESLAAFTARATGIVAAVERLPAEVRAPADRSGVDIDRHAVAALKLWVFLPLNAMLELAPDKVGGLIDVIERRFSLPHGYAASIRAEFRPGPVLTAALDDSSPARPARRRRRHRLRPRRPRPGAVGGGVGGGGPAVDRDWPGERSLRRRPQDQFRWQQDRRW